MRPKSPACMRSAEPVSRLRARRRRLCLLLSACRPEENAAARAMTGQAVAACRRTRVGRRMTCTASARRRVRQARGGNATHRRRPSFLHPCLRPCLRNSQASRPRLYRPPPRRTGLPHVPPRSPNAVVRAGRAQRTAARRISHASSRTNLTPSAVPHAPTTRTGRATHRSRRRPLCDESRSRAFHRLA